jgi:hypothetical protein
MSRILKRLTISRRKVNIDLHRSLSSPVVNKRSSIEKILNILLLRQNEPIKHGGDLNPKKLPQWTKIRYKKLITKTRLNKSNIHRVITSDDHVVQGLCPREEAAADLLLRCRPPSVTAPPPKASGELRVVALSKFL